MDDKIIDDLKNLDTLSDGTPHTNTLACHLLYYLVSSLDKPEVLELACGFGKATIYLAAAAKRQGGFLRSNDLSEFLWKGQSVKDLLAKSNLSDVCEITFNKDARWYLLDLLRGKPMFWIDLAYLDLSHTVEVDSFVALALWTHLRPGGIIAFDDLDWVPMDYGYTKNVAEPTKSNVQIIFNYIGNLPDVGQNAIWGHEEIGWRIGLLQKRTLEYNKLDLLDLIQQFNTLHVRQKI